MIKSEFNNSFINDQLSENEKIIYITKESSITLYLPLIYLLISFIFLFIPSFLIVGVIAISFNLIYFYILYLKINSSIYCITNKRIIIKTGFVNRNSIDIPLSRVAGVNLNQSVVGRIFNFGSISINGFGGDIGKAYLLNNPLEFKKYLQDFLD